MRKTFIAAREAILQMDEVPLNEEDTDRLYFIYELYKRDKQYREYMKAMDQLFCHAKVLGQEKFFQLIGDLASLSTNYEVPIEKVMELEKKFKESSI